MKKTTTKNNIDIVHLLTTHKCMGFISLTPHWKSGIHSLIFVTNISAKLLLWMNEDFKRKDYWLSVISLYRSIFAVIRRTLDSSSLKCPVSSVSSLWTWAPSPLPRRSRICHCISSQPGKDLFWPPSHCPSSFSLTPLCGTSSILIWRPDRVFSTRSLWK